jgi:hypothetical protein
MVIKRKTALPLRRKPVDMRRFHRETNTIKRDEIASHTLHMLWEHYSGKLRLFDVKEMFQRMWEAGDENSLDLRQLRCHTGRWRSSSGLRHRRGCTTMVR